MENEEFNPQHVAARQLAQELGDPKLFSRAMEANRNEQSYGHDRALSLVRNVLGGALASPEEIAKVKQGLAENKGENLELKREEEMVGLEQALIIEGLPEAAKTLIQARIDKLLEIREMIESQKS